MRSQRGRSMRVIVTSGATLFLTAALLAGAPVAEAASCKFPATGQTTCWDSSGNVIACAVTGQDGEIQAGKKLKFKDNGDGTIKDKVTGLIWEKKSDDGSINDVDTTYTWDNAFAAHVAGLNAANFAGRNDWRVPNVKELQSIIDYEAFNPAVDPAFNNGCTPGCTVLTCSCTSASTYWSSSTFADGPSDAWLVNFNFGGVFFAGKDNSVSVRAVRGGCR